MLRSDITDCIFCCLYYKLHPKLKACLFLMSHLILINVSCGWVLQITCSIIFIFVNFGLFKCSINFTQ